MIYAPAFHPPLPLTLSSFLKALLQEEPQTQKNDCGLWVLPSMELSLFNYVLHLFLFHERLYPHRGKYKRNTKSGLWKGKSYDWHNREVIVTSRTLGSELPSSQSEKRT